jgi:SAM-dependent methyltransferase
MKAIVDARRRRYSRFLVGRGLEIGALGNPMPLPNATEVVYSDILRPEQVDAMYPGSRHPDIISDSERFDGVAIGEFDFVVANHVLEHVTDPIGALTQWHRVLKPGGLLLISLPDKRYTFDHRRKRTKLDHLEGDHHSDLSPQLRNECHLLEWAEHVERLEPGSGEFDEWVADQRRRAFAVHNHVWVLQDVLELLAHLRDEYGVAFRLVRWSNTSPLGNEFNLLLHQAGSERAGVWRMRVARIAAIATHPLHELTSRARRLRRA